MSELAWYAGYGSNLSTERFHRYLTGGNVEATPHLHAESGARDHSLPRDTWAGTTPGRLYFAGQSTKWAGGGVAFFDPHAEGQTLMRAYLITVEQMEDVHRQEARGESPIRLDIGAAVAAGGVDVYPDSWYDRLHYLGSHDDGRPMFTITSSRIHEPNTPPHHSYRAVIERGLQEGFDLDDGSIAAYLDAAIATGD